MNKVHKRGFASMKLSRLKKVSAKGGKQAHHLGKAHTFTTEEAKKWGAKGGKASKKLKV